MDPDWLQDPNQFMDPTFNSFTSIKSYLFILRFPQASKISVSVVCPASPWRECLRILLTKMGTPWLNEHGLTSFPLNSTTD